MEGSGPAAFSVGKLNPLGPAVVLWSAPRDDIVKAPVLQPLSPDVRGLLVHLIGDIHLLSPGYEPQPATL